MVKTTKPGNTLPIFMGGARITLMPKEALVFTSGPALTSSRAVLTAKPPQRLSLEVSRSLLYKNNPYLRDKRSAIRADL